jgi:hypothetical protein
MTRFVRYLKRKLFCGAPPPAEPVISVNNGKKHAGKFLHASFFSRFTQFSPADMFDV